MKNIFSKMMVLCLILIMPMIMLAQNPPHPNGGNNPGGGNTPVGGGAPIDGGLSILIALGSAYAGRKLYKMNNNN
ncbi:MAG: hypothetical protein R2764_20605 [Bacteroidales bacterium]